MVPGYFAIFADVLSDLCDLKLLGSSRKKGKTLNRKGRQVFAKDAGLRKVHGEEFRNPFSRFNGCPCAAAEITGLQIRALISVAGEHAGRHR